MSQTIDLSDAKYLSVNQSETNDERSLFERCKNCGSDFLLWSLKVCDVVTEEDDVYNEQLLALMRIKFLKAEEAGVNIVIKPVCENTDGTLFSEDVVTSSMKHAARRLKKCEALIGFVVPFPENEKARQFFIDELSQKHEHYKFFLE